MERAHRRTVPLCLAGGVLLAVGLASSVDPLWVPWSAGMATAVLIAFGALVMALRPRWLHLLGALAWVGAIHAAQLGLMAGLILAGAMMGSAARLDLLRLGGALALFGAGALCGWLGVARTVVAWRFWRTVRADEAEDDSGQR